MDEGVGEVDGSSGPFKDEAKEKEEAGRVSGSFIAQALKMKGPVTLSFEASIAV